ncbi:MAG: hypothetical protein U0X40_09495 [Ferruginibacter sp.]
MKKICFFAASLLLMASCVSNKKIAAARERLNGIKTQLEGESGQLKDIGLSAGNRLESNRIDSNILQRINKRLTAAGHNLDSVQGHVSRLDEIFKTKRSVRQNYKKIVIPLLDSLQQQSDRYAQRLGLYMMIKDGLSVADFKLFDLAAFFGPGKYSIPEDKVDIAAQSFSPVLDSLLNFSNKYSAIPRTATLIILGFADGTGYTPGSPLYDTLVTQLGRADASKEELNQQISELRARELIKQLTNLYLRRATEFKEVDKLHIEYIGQGKGEQYPMSSIKDYRVDDERRRIVLCYWVVLPD